MDPIYFQGFMEQQVGVNVPIGEVDGKLCYERGFKVGADPDDPDADFSAADLATLHASVAGLDAIETGITAGTTQTQGDATALTAAFNVIGTCANANDGVKLPLAVAGLKVTVVNLGANVAKIYPNTSDTIDGGTANVAITIPVGAAYTFKALSAVDWRARRMPLNFDWGIGTLDGANPTPVSHRLNQIVGAVIGPVGSTTPGLDTHHFRHAISGNTLNVYAWKPTSSSDGTLVASTNSSATFFWLAVGY